MRSGTRTPHPDLLIYYRVVCGSGWGRDETRAARGRWCGVRESPPGGHRTSWGPWVSFPRGSHTCLGWAPCGGREGASTHTLEPVGEVESEKENPTGKGGPLLAGNPKGRNMTRGRGAPGGARES